MNISSQRICASIRNLRVLFFAFVFLIGAFDYDFFSYAKQNSFTASYKVYVYSSSASVNAFLVPQSSTPVFWTDRSSVSFTVNSFSVGGVNYDDSTNATYTLEYYDSSGSKIITDNIWLNSHRKVVIDDINTSKNVYFNFYLGTSRLTVTQANSVCTVTLTDEVLLSDNEALNEIVDQNEKFHEEEKTEATNAGNDLGSTLDDVTGTLSKVEILKLPWTMLTDLFNALKSDGETSLTFPSFSLMGQTLWPSYTFSLSTLDSQFSVLFESVRLVSGVMLCVAFGKYLRSFFTKVFGNQEDQEDL